MPTPEEIDWTVDPDTGCSNSSPEFVAVRNHIASLLLTERHLLEEGDQYGTDLGTRVELVAQLIAAQVAHVLHLAPAGPVNSQTE